MRHLTAYGVIGLLAGLLATPGLAWGQPDPQRAGGQRQRGPTLVVSGEARTQAAPDMATLRLGAIVQAEEATAAQEQVSRIMEEAIEAVKALGVAEERIRTADLALYPVYTGPPPRPLDGREGGEEEPRIVGFRATNTLAVEMEDLEKIGDVIDAAVEAGANQLQGVEFELRNDLEARSEALRRATRIARAKAEVMAEAAGMSLGDLVEIRESGIHIRPPEPMYGARMAMEQAASTPVQPGQLTVTADVTLVYRLRQGAGGRQDRDRPATRPGD